MDTKIKATIRGTHLNEPFTYSIHPSTSETTNLTKYIFRQKTQELLYESKKYALENKDISWGYFPSRRSQYEPQNQEKEKENELKEKELKEKELKEKELKEKLKTFLEQMMNYIKENQLEDDKFLKMLCDDIYINYKFIGRRYAALLSCARQTSQGRQTTYNVSLPEDEEEEYEMQRTHLNKNSSVFFQYATSDSTDSPYSTQGVIETMSHLSCFSNLCGINKDDNDNTEA